MQKYFVLDTNVLLHNADSISSFADNAVIIPMDVIEELDRFKRDSDERGRNARYVIRRFDSLRNQGNLGEGIKMSNGGTLKIVTVTDEMLHKHPLSSDIIDNRILSIAYNLKEEGHLVIFVSKDINARVKADAIGIHAVDYNKQKVDFENLYDGWTKVEFSDEDIDRYSQEGSLEASGSFEPNEFVFFSPGANGSRKTAIGIYKEKKKRIYKLNKITSDVLGIKPRNKEQAMAFELLLDNEIKLVTLLGCAGTGKTLLALAAGLVKTLVDNSYKKLLVTRPVMPLGKDIGYLPGAKSEKVSHWMGPIYDNLEFLLSGQKKKLYDMEKLIKSGAIEMEPLTYMRGRSIPNQFIIIDEAQNLTPHEIKTIVSRAGDGTKLVLTGDPYQIDSPYLDSESNGLTYTVERMKGQTVFGHITLTDNERSPLASLAAEIL